MKCFFVMVFALAPVACSREIDVETLEIFDAAQKTFDKATDARGFLDAAALYQSLLDRDIESGAVLYNLGNAYMMAKEKGRAIAAYREAQRYRPRDPLLKANLDAARASVPRARESRSLVDHVFFWRHALSQTEQWGLASGLVTLVFLIAVARIFVRRRVGVVLAIALFATMLDGVSLGLTWLENREEHGVIIEDVVARKGDAETFEPAFNESLVEGVEFRVLDERGEWIQIEVEGGQIEGGLSGWIPVRHAVTF